MGFRQIHHQVDYIELAVNNLEASKAFYGKAFGWGFNDYGPEYAGIKANDIEFGGLRLDSNVMTGGPLVVMYSNDLTKSLKAVVDAGGEVTKDIFSFPGGKRFQFTDPSGNELAVWSKS